MKISSFHVNGFGVFHNTGLREITSGLNIFTGDNESGKSTLLRFLRAVIFGISRNIPKDEPLRGGEHGGSMEIDLENGNSLIFELRKRRIHITDKKGDLLDHGTALELMGGIDRHLFERVFAVGLEDLYLDGDSLLDEEKLRNRLFSAGAGLGTISISKAFSELEKDMQKLAWNRTVRSRSRIKDDSGRLLEVRKQLRDLADLEKEYAGLLEEKQILTGKIEDISHELETLGKNEIELKRLHSILEPFARLQSLRKEIVLLEKNVKELPPAASERHSAIKRDIRNFEDKLQKTEKEIESARIEIGYIKVNSRVLELSGKIESFREERSRFTDLQEELVMQVAKEKTLSNELDLKLSQISPEWNVEDLMNADTSLVSGKEALDLIGRFKILESELFQAKFLYEEEEMEKERALKEFTKARSISCEYEDDEETEEEISSLIDDILKSKEILMKIDHLKENIGILESSFCDLKERLEDLESEEGKSDFPARSIFLLLPAILILTGIPAVHYLLGMAYFPFVTGLSAIFSALLIFLWKKQDLHFKKSLDKVEREKHIVKEKLEKIRTEISELESQMDVLNNDLIPIWEKLGVDHDVTRERLEECVVSANLRLARAKEKKRTLLKLKDMHEKFQQKVNSVSIKGEKVKNSREKFGDLEVKWKNYLEEKGFPVNTSPESFQILVQAVISAVKVFSGKKEVSERILQLNELERSGNEELDDLITQCSLSFEGSIAEKITFMVGQLKNNKESQEKKNDLDKRLRELVLQREDLQKGFESALSGMKELMDRSNATSEEVFFSRLEEYDRYSHLKDKEMEISSRLIGLAGNEDLLDILLGKVADLDTLTLEMDLANNGNRRMSLSGKKEEAIRKLAKTELRLQELTVEETQSQLFQEKEFLHAKCRENSLKWAALAVCRNMLAQARENHEIKRQPDVTRLASKYMETITGGRYGLMCSALDRRIFLSDKSTLSRKESSEWSSGLSDQAYLAIRLAVAKNLSGSSGVLPLVLDDIHLRFDPQRQKYLLQALMEHARFQQVFLFSCNPALLEMIPSVMQPGYSKPGIYRIEEGCIND